MAWTAGFQSSGGPTKGAGFAWDVSFSSGCGSATGETQSTVLSTQRTQNSIVNKDADRIGISLIPAGSMFAAPQTIVATLYRFYDAQGHLISDARSSADGQAMKCALIRVRNNPLATYPYTPFLVTPGQLESYTPEAINAQMNSNLPFLKTPRLVHRRTPPWTDYFQDVIGANAYEFGNGSGSGGQKYLSFSWQYDGKVASTFNAPTTSFTENTWTLDTKAYAGISGGEGAEIFGFGISAQFKFLAGFSLSAKTVTKTAEGNSWGIALNECGAPGWGDTNGFNALNHYDAWLQAIARYDFGLFYLPPPSADSDFGENYWAAELVDLLPTAADQTFTDVSDIDPNSGTWKIIFVVTAYATNEDWFLNNNKWTYQYTGSLPQIDTRRGG